MRRLNAISNWHSLRILEIELRSLKTCLGFVLEKVYLLLILWGQRLCVIVLLLAVVARGEAAGRGVVGVDSRLRYITNTFTSLQIISEIIKLNNIMAYFSIYLVTKDTLFSIKKYTGYTCKYGGQWQQRNN